MNSWNLRGSFQRVIVAETIDEASSKLRALLATAPEVRKIILQFDPTKEEVAPWLDAAKAAAPEIRGLMVQRFFARIFIRAGYEVVVGRELDIFARGRLRSLLIEVKSSLAGGKFGSRAELSQVDGYLIASERRQAERWFGTMGINKPILLRDTFKNKLRSKNIGLIDIRWMSPKETLLAHLSSVP